MKGALAPIAATAGPKSALQHVLQQIEKGHKMSSDEHRDIVAPTEGDPVVPVVPERNFARRGEDGPWIDAPVVEDDRPYMPQGRIGQLFDLCRDPEVLVEVLVEGSAGTGKIRALLELVNIRAMKFPGSRHLLRRKTRAAITDSVLVTFEDKVIPRGSPITQDPKRQFRHAYDYPNGSTVVCGGLDNAERTFSTEYDTMTLSESIKATPLER